MIVKEREWNLHNGRGLACEVLTLLQQPCTLSSQWRHQGGSHVELSEPQHGKYCACTCMLTSALMYRPYL